MTLCIHNLDQNSCTYCNGDYDRKVELRDAIRKETDELASLRNDFRKPLKGECASEWEDWSEDEYQAVYDNLQGLRRRTIKWYRVAKRVADQIGRSPYAVMWKSHYIFSEDNSLKAGKKLLAFKLKINPPKQEVV